MYRARIETLEKRQMFAADNLSDVVAAYVLGNCPNWFMDPNPPPVFGELHNKLAGDSADTINLQLALSRTETVGKDESITVGAAMEAPSQNFLSLNFEKYKTNFTDGTSNTMMFASKSAESEHMAQLFQHGPQANGIIAILIGLAADPSDSSGSTHAVANFALSDGSARFGGSDVSGTLSLVGSDEYFSRFANTILDDQALVATTYGRGLASRITHDIEFENWASVSRFERGTMSLELENILISSVRGGSSHADGINQVVGPDRILHEDNEFYFPRM